MATDPALKPAHLEHFPFEVVPGSTKKMRPNRDLERRSDTGGSECAPGAQPPSPWVVHYLKAAALAGGLGQAAGDTGNKPRPLTALDVATGSGRHLRLARSFGYATTAVDRDLSGVADQAGVSGVELMEIDLEDGSPWPLLGRTFDVVITTNYLHRARLPDIVAATAPAGLFIYETFAIGNERSGKPSNPNFLLKPGELSAAVADLLIPIAFEHARLSQPLRVIQRIVAVGSHHPWAIEPPLGRSQFE